MSIRPVHDDDFDAIAAITNHYIETSAIHFSYDPISAAELRARWTANPRHPYLVDDRAGIVAYAKAGPWRDRAAYAWTAELGIYVAPEARGGGIGTSIYRALIDACAAAGFRSVVAGITMPNDVSIALHRRLGFEPIGTFQNAGWKRGAWHGVAFFQKVLSTSTEPPL